MHSNPIRIFDAVFVNTRDIRKSTNLYDDWANILDSIFSVHMPSDGDFNGRIGAMFDLECTEVQKEAALKQLDVKLLRSFSKQNPSDRLELKAMRLVGKYKVLALIRSEITDLGTWTAVISLNEQKLAETSELAVVS